MSRYASEEAEQRAVNSRKSASEARNEALKRLRQRHKAEYDRLYAEEAVKRGVQPNSVRKEARRARLIAELRSQGFEVLEHVERAES